MEQNLLVFIAGLPTVGVVNVLWFIHELRVFLELVPRLETERDLDQYKRMVSRQMIAALFQIVILIAPALVYVYGVVTDQLTAVDMLYLLVPCGVLIALGLWAKNWETQAKEIPVVDSEMADARDHIVYTWMHKALPDW